MITVAHKRQTSNLAFSAASVLYTHVPQTLDCFPKIALMEFEVASYWINFLHCNHELSVLVFMVLSIIKEVLNEILNTLQSRDAFAYMSLKLLGCSQGPEWKFVNATSIGMNSPHSRVFEIVNKRIPRSLTGHPTFWIFWLLRDVPMCHQLWE